LRAEIERILGEHLAEIDLSAVNSPETYSLNSSRLMSSRQSQTLLLSSFDNQGVTSSSAALLAKIERVRQEMQLKLDLLNMESNVMVNPKQTESANLSKQAILQSLQAITRVEEESESRLPSEFGPNSIIHRIYHELSQLKAKARESIDIASFLNKRTKEKDELLGKVDSIKRKYDQTISNLQAENKRLKTKCNEEVLTSPAMSQRSVSKGGITTEEASELKAIAEQQFKRKEREDGLVIAKLQREMECLQNKYTQLEKQEKSLREELKLRKADLARDREALSVEQRKNTELNRVVEEVYRNKNEVVISNNRITSTPPPMGRTISSYQIITDQKYIVTTPRNHNSTPKLNPSPPEAYQSFVNVESRKSVKDNEELSIDAAARELVNLKMLHEAEIEEMKQWIIAALRKLVKIHDTNINRISLSPQQISSLGIREEILNLLTLAQSPSITPSKSAASLSKQETHSLHSKSAVLTSSRRDSIRPVQLFPLNQVQQINPSTNPFEGREGSDPRREYERPLQVGGVGEINMFRKVRLLRNVLRDVMSKVKLRAFYRIMQSKFRSLKSKNEASLRIKAKMLLALRSAVKPVGVRRAFLRWLVLTSPTLVKGCVQKIALTSKINHTSTFWRMRPMLTPHMPSPMIAPHRKPKLRLEGRDGFFIIPPSNKAPSSTSPIQTSRSNTPIAPSSGGTGSQANPYSPQRNPGHPSQPNRGGRTVTTTSRTITEDNTTTENKTTTVTTTVHSARPSSNPAPSSTPRPKCPRSAVITTLLHRVVELFNRNEHSGQTAFFTAMKPSARRVLKVHSGLMLLHGVVAKGSIRCAFQSINALKAVRTHKKNRLDIYWRRLIKALARGSVGKEKDALNRLRTWKSNKTKETIDNEQKSASRSKRLAQVLAILKRSCKAKCKEGYQRLRKVEWQSRYIDSGLKTRLKGIILRLIGSMKTLEWNAYKKLTGIMKEHPLRILSRIAKSSKNRSLLIAVNAIKRRVKIRSNLKEAITRGSRGKIKDALYRLGTNVRAKRYRAEKLKSVLLSMIKRKAGKEKNLKFFALSKLKDRNDRVNKKRSKIIRLLNNLKLKTFYKMKNALGCFKTLARNCRIMENLLKNSMKKIISGLFRTSHIKKSLAFYKLVSRCTRSKKLKLLTILLSGMKTYRRVLLWKGVHELRQNNNIVKKVTAAKKMATAFAILASQKLFIAHCYTKRWRQVNLMLRNRKIKACQGLAKVYQNKLRSYLTKMIAYHKSYYSSNYELPVPTFGGLQREDDYFGSSSPFRPVYAGQKNKNDKSSIYTPNKGPTQYQTKPDTKNPTSGSKSSEPPQPPPPTDREPTNTYTPNQKQSSKLPAQNTNQNKTILSSQYPSPRPTSDKQPVPVPKLPIAPTQPPSQAHKRFSSDMSRDIDVNRPHHGTSSVYGYYELNYPSSSFSSLNLLLSALVKKYSAGPAFKALAQRSSLFDKLKRMLSSALHKNVSANRYLTRLGLHKLRLHNLRQTIDLQKSLAFSKAGTSILQCVAQRRNHRTLINIFKYSVQSIVTKNRRLAAMRSLLRMVHEKAQRNLSQALGYISRRGLARGGQKVEEGISGAAAKLMESWAKATTSDKAKHVSRLWICQEAKMRSCLSRLLVNCSRYTRLQKIMSKSLQRYSTLLSEIMKSLSRYRRPDDSSRRASSQGGDWGWEAGSQSELGNHNSASKVNIQLQGSGLRSLSKILEPSIGKVFSTLITHAFKTSNRAPVLTQSQYVSPLSAKYLDSSEEHGTLNSRLLLMLIFSKSHSRYQTIARSSLHEWSSRTKAQICRVSVMVNALQTLLRRRLEHVLEMINLRQENRRLYQMQKATRMIAEIFKRMVSGRRKDSYLEIKSRYYVENRWFRQIIYIMTQRTHIDRSISFWRIRDEKALGMSSVEVSKAVKLRKIANIFSRKEMKLKASTLTALNYSILNPRFLSP
jgi:hypothetical protein